jgi:hypothetical protein
VTTRRGKLVLVALAAAAALLIAIEFAFGALHFGRTTLADPCTAEIAFQGDGIDGAIQRFALSGLNGAACRLHTSREELVLSFSPTATTRIRWNAVTISAALQAGFSRAAESAAGNGLLGRLAALLVRNVVADPLEWLLGRTH